jgi:GT2 family glycosyltransferase
MSVRTAVVILNWNGKRFLEQFLPSVVNHSQTAQIVVADNASTDDSVIFLKKNYPAIRIIQNTTNVGFAKGYNDALSKVDADYFVLLNSDIEVTTGWIKPVIDMMEADHSIAACQPKLLSFQHREKFEYAGAAGGFIDKFGYPFCRGRLFQTTETDAGQYDDSREIFWATGACLFVRSDVYRRLGGLDERFFAHMEEIDFCWRAKNEGLKIMVCPDSKVFHVGGGTLPKRSWRKTYLNMKNNNIMLFKNLPSHQLFSVFSARLILDGIAAFKFLFDGGFMDFFAVIKAHFRFYSMLPALLRERKAKHLHPVTMIYRKNMVWEYFLRQKRRFTDLDQEYFT